MENGVFRFSLSYMIYSEAFDQLTEPWRVAAVERLRSILTATKPDLLATAKR